MTEKASYKIGIHGCDDTYLFVDLTVEEAALMERLAALSEKESTCVCMPTLAVEKQTPKAA